MKHKTKKRRRGLLRPLLLLLLILFIVLTISSAFSKPEILPDPSLSYPIGTELTLSDVVKKVKGGSLLDPDKKIDSSKEGSQSLNFKTKNTLGVEFEESITIDFYLENKNDESISDHRTAPKITGPEAITLYEGEKPDLTVFSATDHEGNKIEIKFSGEYDLNKVGNYTLNLSATDKEGLVTKKEVSLLVYAKPLPSTTTAVPTTTKAPVTTTQANDSRMEDGTFTTKNGKTLIIKNGLATVDGILIANKSYSLPKSYTSNYLSAETEQAYYKMRDAAKEAGHTLTIKSAYRSWNDQNYIFNGYVKNHGLEEALTFSARPGHSEHQTGLAMDIITSSSVDSQKPEIKVILDWISENAADFGFILRYPEGKSDITGYIYEPWHYRYVGKDLAKTLYNGGDWITLEEYFGIDSVYKGY